MSAPVKPRAACSGVVSRRCSNTSLDSGGCVGIVASCEEGAGASSAIGQASAFHGIASPRVKRARWGPRSRCIPGRRRQTGPADTRPTATAWWSGSSAVGSLGGPAHQRAIPLPGGTHRGRRSTAVRAQHPRDRRPTPSSAVDNFEGAAPQRAGRSRPSALRRSSAGHRASRASSSAPSRHQ